MNSTTSGTSIYAQQCQHCGCVHGAVCPSVRSVEYWPDGRIKKVEYERGQGIEPQPFPWWPSPEQTAPPQKYEIWCGSNDMSARSYPDGLMVN